jgi:plasmid stability protein
MAQVSVINLPKEVVRKLKMRARQHGRSLQEELKNVLKQAAQQNEKMFRQRSMRFVSCLPAVSSVTVPI